MSIVLHSECPYLLARMATDLEMEGVKNDRVWNDCYNPFESVGIRHLMVQSWFEFHTHDCSKTPIKLTSRNYNTVLEKVLKTIK